MGLEKALRQKEGHHLTNQVSQVHMSGAPTASSIPVASNLGNLQSGGQSSGLTLPKLAEAS